MPKISIIIPVYNGEKTIRETIDSVFAQTFQDWELIISNDGSSDRTLEIVTAISDPRIRIISDVNAGLSESRNRGIKMAIGAYISFLDADDLWSPDKLEAQLQALENNPEAAVAYSWTDYIDDRGNWVRSGLHLSPQGNVLSELFLHNFLENGSNLLVRREAIDRIGYFETSLTSVQDWDFYLRLADRYHFVPVSRSQIFYRISDTSFSTNLQRHHSQSLLVIELALKRNPELLQPLKNKSLSLLYKYLACKVFSTSANRKNGRLSLYFSWQYFRYESLKFSGIKLFFILFIKGIFLTVLGNENLDKNN
ncbi:MULTISPECIES: glycosyltransferase [Spirulina sp. CCY15215]|uniref:glycosyltransferase family 2 protein n=1 Tax=Spirulina sp. CCY15215 TaxID=2767591 RepID=UPI0019521F69|nr:glycosyltransferase [Spirulina major]